MEGYTYALTNMGVSQPVLDDKLAVNNALFDENSTADAVRALCEERGIGYLVYCTPFEGGASHLAGLEPVFESETVTIWKVQ